MSAGTNPRDMCPSSGLRDAGVSSAAAWMVPDHAFSSSGICSMDVWARAFVDRGPWKMRGQASGPTATSTGSGGGWPYRP